MICQGGRWARFGVVKEVLSSSQWTREVKARGKCERCPRTERLHAHHIDRDTTNNTIENGECLCVWCHDAEHGGDGSIIAWDTASRNMTDETKRKLSEAARGKPKSESHRRKIKEAVSNPSEETRRRKSDAQRRHHEDPEARARRQAAMQAMWEPGGSRFHERRARIVREQSDAADGYSTTSGQNERLTAALAAQTTHNGRPVGRPSG